MRVLWITNTIFPAVCTELGIAKPVVGGWMYSSAQYLIDTFNDIKLGVASLYEGKTIKTINNNGISYFMIPQSKPKNKYDKNLEKHWITIANKFDADVVHIHGTEYPHGLAYVNACGSADVVVSIQGLVSIIERYYLGGINPNGLRKSKTIRDWVKRDSLIKQQKKMLKQGEYEKALIKKVNNIIGRTNWDKSHTWALNPKAKYHFNNETLRDEFYKKSWNPNKCIKHQIFLSQSYYPLKGLQQVIKALPLILDHYPDAKVCIAGEDFINNKESWRINGYEKYIRKLIRSLGLDSKIKFTGTLNEKEMCEKYLESNVFICPSSIENSSNSIAEAQLLGIPCVASYVGGTSDMVNNEKTGMLYRFEETEMLANAVCRIFSDPEFATELSYNEKSIASKRHDKLKNARELFTIYQEICKK